MNHYINGLVAIVALGLASGCQTTGWDEQRAGDERLASEVAELRIALERMEHRLADLSGEQDDLGADVADLGRSLREQRASHDNAISSLSSKIEEQDRARRALRQELTDDLSSRMEEVIRTQVRAAGGSQGRGSRAEVGYEHEVQPGETLSEIARAYGVTSQDILQANDLRNPDVLRVGQVLFIPER